MHANLSRGKNWVKLKIINSSLQSSRGTWEEKQLADDGDKVYCGGRHSIYLGTDYNRMVFSRRPVGGLPSPIPDHILLPQPHPTPPLFLTPAPFLPPAARWRFPTVGIWRGTSGTVPINVVDAPSSYIIVFNVWFRFVSSRNVNVSIVINTVHTWNISV